LKAKIIAKLFNQFATLSKAFNELSQHKNAALYEDLQAVVANWGFEVRDE